MALTLKTNQVCSIGNPRSLLRRFVRVNAATHQRTGMFGFMKNRTSPSNHEFAKPRDRKINAFAKPTVVGRSGINLCAARTIPRCGKRVITLTGERNKGPPSREKSHETS